MKAMKLRQVLHSGRATVAALAGTVMVIGGAGAGTAALALSHSAGALSLQAPAIAVKEQNVNAAGRIRVALPNGGVGVNGTVSVNNFPKTQPVTGTVNIGNLPTSNTGGSSRIAEFNTTAGPGQTVVVNISGKGIFNGLELADWPSGNSSGNYGCGAYTILADGQAAWSSSISGVNYWFDGSSSVRQAGNNQAGGAGTQLWPPTGFAFQHSLQISITTNGCGPGNLNGTPNFRGVVSYTLQ